MNPLFDKPFTFDRVARIVFSILMISGILYLVAILKNALLPFLIAWLMAYMMQPFVRFFQYKLKLRSRVLSIVMVLLLSAGLLTLLYLLVVPSIVDEIQRTFDLIQTHQGNPGDVPLIPESWRLYIANQLDVLQLSELVSRENMLNAVKQIAPQLWSLLSGTFSLLFSITIVFVILLYFIFILLDYEKIAEGWIKLIPERYRPFTKGLAEDVEDSMNRYFRGQALIALCVGVLFAIGFRIIDFPLAVSLGLFIGFLNLIPYLQTLGLIPMALLSLLKSTETGENFWLIFGLS
ncbi:MAG: AI-2E family transporter, partial [Porphyromonadaceae bacterium]|nr:AI-2E family transporter [Porphyromonadaceae bacterium]